MAWVGLVAVAVAAVSYRLSPATWARPDRTEGVTHPAHMIDCTRAFAWLHAHARTEDVIILKAPPGMVETL